MSENAVTENLPLASMLPPPDEEADDRAFRRQTIILNVVLWVFINEQGAVQNTRMCM